MIVIEVTKTVMNALSTHTGASETCQLHADAGEADLQFAPKINTNWHRCMHGVYVWEHNSFQDKLTSGTPPLKI